MPMPKGAKVTRNIFAAYRGDTYIMEGTADDLHLWRPVKNGWLGEPREMHMDNRSCKVGRKPDPEEDDMIYNPHTGSFFRR